MVANWASSTSICIRFLQKLVWPSLLPSCHFHQRNGLLLLAHLWYFPRCSGPSSDRPNQEWSHGKTPVASKYCCASQRRLSYVNDYWCCAVVWLALPLYGLPTWRKVTVTQSPIPTASANTVPAHMERSLHAVRSEPGPEPQQSRFSSNGQEPYFKPMRGGDYPTQPASFERPIEDNVSATKVTEEKPAKAEEKPLKTEKNSLKEGASDSEPGHLSRFSAKQILALNKRPLRNNQLLLNNQKSGILKKRLH